MVRLADLPQWQREQLLEKRDQLPRLPSPAWAGGPALSRRRVAIVSTAGLQQSGDRPFTGSAGATEYRLIPADAPTGTLMMSHMSVNFDRTGFRRDVNLVFPLDRLRELAARGEIGSVAQFHYSFMGAISPPTRYEASAREVAGLLKRDGVDAAVLFPV